MTKIKQLYLHLTAFFSLCQITDLSHLTRQLSQSQAISVIILLYLIAFTTYGAPLF